MKVNAIFVTIVGFLIFSVAANGLMFLKLNSSNKLLGSLQQVAHASHIQDVRDQLGAEMYEIDNSTWMVRNASIKDPEFHYGKKLYWFSVHGLPARVIEVFTDSDGKVIVVTWQVL